MWISPKTKANYYLTLFSITKIPLLWFCRPKIVHISDKSIEIKIPLKRRTKNHLKTMYFGALCVGADFTAGLLVLNILKKHKSKANLIFKDFQADFIKRAEGDVHFICKEGDLIRSLITKAEETNERQNMPVHIEASVPSISAEPVATFILTLSIKKYS